MADDRHTDTPKYRKRTLTGPEHFALGKFIESHIITLPDTDDEGRNYVVYEDGWTDHRVAVECGLPNIKTNTVEHFRDKTFGLLKYVEPPSSVPKEILNRIGILEHKIADLGGVRPGVTENEMRNRLAELAASLQNSIGRVSVMLNDHVGRVDALTGELKAKSDQRSEAVALFIKEQTNAYQTRKETMEAFEREHRRTISSFQKTVTDLTNRVADLTRKVNSLGAT